MSGAAKKKNEGLDYKKNSHFYLEKVKIEVTIDAQRDPSSKQAADEGHTTWNQPSFPSRI